MTIIFSTMKKTFTLYRMAFRSCAKKHRIFDTECSTFWSWANQHLSVAIISLKIAFLEGTDRCLSMSLRKTIRYRCKRSLSDIYCTTFKVEKFKIRPPPPSPPPIAYFWKPSSRITMWLHSAHPLGYLMAHPWEIFLTLLSNEMNRRIRFAFGKSYCGVNCVCLFFIDRCMAAFLAARVLPVLPSMWNKTALILRHDVDRPC